MTREPPGAVSRGTRGDETRNPVLTRAIAVGAVIAAVMLAAFLLFVRGDGDYVVEAEFMNGGQLGEGNGVRVAGATVGTVEDIRVSDDGQAVVRFSVDEEYAPLRRGTRAIIKQTSQSGIANRFIDLYLGPAGGAEIEDGGRLSVDETQTAVELDQLFAIFDRKTRASTQDLIEGSAELFRGRGEQIRRAVRYLNPSLSTGTRLFRELSRDEPLLERFLVDSAQFVGALAERRDDLRSLVSNANTTFRALGDQQAALAESVELLPPFMRRANTTFVNLRRALDDVDPLVDVSKPAVRRLGPFLDAARAFAADAEPTIRDLRITISRRGRANDLIELVRSFPPLARRAIDRRRVNGAVRRGAFPESEEALRDASETISLLRPYTPDLVGWFEDFSGTGAYDAAGGFSRSQLNLTEIVYGPEPRMRQFRRCPGGADAPASDGSNVLSAEERERLQCDESHRAVAGP
jgi:phospholipid/cholesterol/gamma-HCH transport system substrate-binding protein